MGLESLTNSVEGKISGYAQPKGKIAAMVGFYAMLTSDVVYGLGSKINRTMPSASSQVDKIVMDRRRANGEGYVENEQMAVVTGANCGIGFETAKAIGRAGYHTILACRNEELGREAVERLERQTGLEGRFEFQELDLSSLASVRSFVDGFKARDKPLDILVNNAGVMMCPLGKTKDGIELQFGTNHVGHFALTTGLLDQLKQAKNGARIVTVASLGAFMMCEIDYDALADDSRYDRTNSYGYSKLANILFSTALARKLQGTGVTSNVVHPGVVATNLTRHVGSSRIASFKNSAERALFVDPMAGALSSIYLALSPDAEGVTGQMYARALPMTMHPAAESIEMQDKLWDYTENVIAKSSQ
ncbi:Retinol dehydrogenase 14 [Coemansia sp. RSA 1200]|nr:Retinol dehydrogenase 14 [Coemansia sp. RSA 1200]